MMYTRRHSPPVEYFMEKEAKERGMEYVPWRAITAVGQWMLTDDGVVVQCTKFKEIVEIQAKDKVNGKKRYRYKVGNAISYGYKHGKRPLTFLDFMEKRAHGLVAKEWWKIAFEQHPELLTMFAYCVLMGMPLRHRLHIHQNGYTNYMYRRSDWETFTALDKKLGYKHMNARRMKVLYSTDGAKEMIQNEIARIIEQKNISPEEVFNIMEEALKIARSKKSAKDLLAVADRYAAILAMPHTRRVSAQPSQQLALPTNEETDAMFDTILNNQKREMEDAIVVSEGK